MKDPKYAVSIIGLLTFFWIAAQTGPAIAHSTASSKEADGVYDSVHSLYLDLHKNPELSGHEVQTAAKIAGRIRSLGYEVTEHVGGTGVVGILKNGAGPVVMLRAELDALPVEEKTGLPYASTVHAADDAGHDVPVMHACGHDLHMAALVATAAIMAQSRNTWHGTLMLIGQPAEETISGAKHMVDDGLFKRFTKPDFAVALHVGNEFPAGQAAVAFGPRQANADSLRVTILGRGGHGAAPETTIDPVVIAARTVLSLQTIVSREVKPGEAAVVTVGYVQAGTKNNIISDQAELGLTVRTYKPEIRKQVLAAITRIVNAEALAAGATQMPRIENFETTDAVYNEPKLAERLRNVLSSALGADHVKTEQPKMTSEDFSYFTAQGVPSFFFTLGGADPQAHAAAQSSGKLLPSNHSPLFAPDVDPALRTGITAEVAVLRNLLSVSTGK
jgi:amidohydrolase